MKNKTRPSLKKDEKTIKQLQEEAVSKGVDETAVKGMKTKPAITEVLGILDKKKEKVIVEVNKPEEPKKVDTLNDLSNSQERKATSRQWVGKAAHMRDTLLAQRKVFTQLPLGDKEKPGVVLNKTDKNGVFYQEHVSGAIETVQMNGFKYLIPKGVQAEVPEGVNNVLGASLTDTANAGKEFRIDRFDQQGRSVQEVLS